MNRFVYVGGCTSGEGSRDRVTKAAEAYYGSVEGFTFSRAMSHPDEVRLALDGADAATSSSGALVLPGSRPRRIDAYGAPMPTPRVELMARTVLKTLRMHTPGIGMRSFADVAAVTNYDMDTFGQMITFPRENLRHLGAISRFNAVTTGIAAVKAGIQTSLHYTEGDEYYRLSEEEVLQAKEGHVGVVWLEGGIHDELVIRPQATLARHIERING